MLSLIEIHNTKFKRSFCGYNQNEVNDFLQKIINDYEKLFQDNMELKEDNERLNNKLEHYQQIESTLHNTLIIAKETAEEVKLSAKKQIEIFKQEAEIRSQKIIDEANIKVRRLNEEYETIQKHMQVYCAKIRSLIKSQLDLLDSSQNED